MSSDDSESGSDLRSIPSDLSDSDNDSSSDTTGDGKPVQLIKFQKSSAGDERIQVKIQENVLNSLLKSCGNHRLSIICSVGGVRTGKSFLLNCIKEKLKTMEDGNDGGSLRNRNLAYQGFPFKSSYKAVTEGIYVWSKAFIIEAEEDEVAVILMDCEGINDQFSKPEEITTMLGIPLLLSSILILNFSGDLSTSSFDWLSTFIKKGSKHQNQLQKFQNLSLVVHDWTRLGIARYGAKGGKKVLDQFKNQNISQVGTVVNGFENVECFLLPHIGEKALQENFTGKMADLNKDFSTQLQRYINDLLGASNLATKKIFDNDLTPQEFKHFVEDYTKFFNELPEMEFGLKPESISGVTMETAGKMKILRSLEEYNKIFRARQKVDDYLRETAINALHVQARRKALEIFKSFELPREQERYFEQKFEQELIRINREIKAANVGFRKNKISENLDKAFEKLKMALEDNFPFQPEVGSKVSIDMVFYADEHLENVLRSTKEQAEVDFLEEFEGDDDSEITGLKRALHAKLQPLEEDYLGKNLKNRKRAEDKAEEAIEKLMEGYIAVMQKRIKRLKKIDAETLEEFSNGEVEKMEDKFRGMNIGTYEFTQEWLDNMMEKIQEELETMQLNLEATMGEALKLVGKEETKYKEDLTEKATEMDEDEVLAYHEEQVEVILRRFKTDNPFPVDNPKHDQVETKLKVKLQGIYEKVVIDGVMMKRKQEEELENTMESTVSTMERDLKRILDDVEFMEVDECGDYMKSREEEIKKEFTEKVGKIGVDRDKLEESMENFKKLMREAMQKSLRDNMERRQLAVEEADQLVEKCAGDYERKMNGNLEKLNSLEELRQAHQNIKENVVQQFVKGTTTKNQRLIEESVQKLEFKVDEMSEEIEDLFNMKKESEDRALFGAIMEVKKFYQEGMDKQFNNNKNGYFKENELRQMDKKIHQDAMKNLTTDTPLNGKQKGKLEEQLNKLFQKYKEKNSLIEHSYKSKDAAIGIDLGTTYCCVAVYHMGQVKIIRNSLGENTTPSYVTINADGSTVVGATAKKQSFRNPEATVFDAKRILGRRLDDEKLREDMKFWPFVVEEKGGKAQIKVHGKYYHPEEISGMILKHLKKEAEDIMGLKVKKAVITVPAYFTDGQRQATVDAGELAGLKVLGILNEPTAAAVAYRLEWYSHGRPRKILIYDLGGGTFDVAVLEISEDKIDVLSIGGDSHLGGEDFDKNMMGYCVKEFKGETGIDLMEGKNSGEKTKVDEAKRSLKRLQLNCEDAKKQLSTARSTTIAIDAIIRGEDLNVEVRREKFEEMNDGLFRETVKIVEKALESAGVGKDEIDDVVLVGGSTRIGKLQGMLEACFPNKALNRQINPDEAVAYGAAVQAAILNASPGARLFDFGQIQEVTPMSLGIEVASKEMDVIIPKNTKFPTEVKQEYRTHRSGQTTASIRIFQGEEVVAEKNKLLGNFVLSGIPQGPAGKECVDVRMIIDGNGILSVEAICRSTKGKNSITVSEEKGRLSKEDKKRILAE